MTHTHIHPAFDGSNAVASAICGRWFDGACVCVRCVGAHVLLRVLAGPSPRSRSRSRRHLSVPSWVNAP